VCREYVGNKHLENMQLRALEDADVPFDIAFFVMLRRRYLKTDGNAQRPEGG
jgi:hypothetical protein